MDNNSYRTIYVKKNAIVGTVYSVLSTVFPFIIRTLMIKYLGEEYLGLNDFCLSAIWILNISNFGIDTAFKYHLFKPIAENDKEQIEALLLFYSKVYRIFGIAILVIGIIIMPFLTYFIKCDMPAGINLYIVYLAYLLIQVIEYVFVATTTLYFDVKQENYINLLIYLASTIILYILQIFFIIRSCFYAFVFISFFRTITTLILKLVIRKHRYPDICFNTRQYKVKKEFKKELAYDTFGVAVYRIRDVTRSTFDSFILSAFMGLRIMARYQNYVMIFNVPVMINSVIVNSVLSSLGDYLASYGKEKAYEVFKIILFINVVVSGWCAVFYYILIQDFIVIWVGGELLLSKSVALLFAIYLYVYELGQIMRMLRTVTGTWENGKITAIIEMVANIILNISLVSLIGTPGIILATVLTMSIIYLPYEFYMVSKYIFPGKLPDIWAVVIKNILWVIIMGLASAMLCNLVPQIYFWRLCIKAGIGIFVPVIVFFIMYGKDELFKTAVAYLLPGNRKRIEDSI